MSSAFSSNDADCVARSLDQPISNIVDEQIWDECRLNECVQWIEKHSFARVKDETRSIMLFFISFPFT